MTPFRLTDAILLIAFLLSLGGCATRAMQTESVLARSRGTLAVRHVEDVPFIEQSAGHCGPATLTMALRARGSDAPLEEVTAQVFTPGMKGTFQSDMVASARRQGMTAIPIRGLENLMAEIDAGHPVIVFMNLSLSWAPNWHYAVVTGYDLVSEEIIMHSGPDADRRWDLRKFERSWMLGDYWGLVVLRPGERAPSAGELDHARAAAGLEQVGRLEEAERSYRALLERWPSSLAGLVGAGNVAFARGRYAESVRWLKRAERAHPTSASVRHNLAVASAALKASSVPAPASLE